MDNPFAEMLNEIAKEIRENDALQEKPVNRELPTQEEAFTLYRRLLTLRPGDTVTYKTTKSEKQGIFIKFTDEGRPLVLSWEDGKSYGQAIPPTCIILDDEIYDIDDDDIDEFHRT